MGLFLALALANALIIHSSLNQIKNIIIKYKSCIKKTDITEIQTRAVLFKSNASDHCATETFYYRLRKCYIEIFLNLIYLILKFFTVIMKENYIC